jgi:hypothetical protein
VCATPTQSQQQQQHHQQQQQQQEEEEVKVKEKRTTPQPPTPQRNPSTARASRVVSCAGVGSGPSLPRRRASTRLLQACSRDGLFFREKHEVCPEPVSIKRRFLSEKCGGERAVPLPLHCSVVLPEGGEQCAAVHCRRNGLFPDQPSLALLLQCNPHKPKQGYAHTQTKARVRTHTNQSKGGYAHTQTNMALLLVSQPASQPASQQASG